MKKAFRENSFFNLTLRERKSVFFLLGMLIVSVLFYILSFYIPTKADFIVSNSLDSLNTIEIDMSSEDESGSMDLINEGILHNFDPNNISREELIKLGVSEKVAGTWVKYIEKGGRFKNITALSKIYGLTSEKIALLEPYARFDSEVIKHPFEIKPKIIQTIDPNTAAYKDLIDIGISSQIANTLLKYRSSGAVFKNIGDVKKVRGINDSILSQIATYLKFPDLPVIEIPTITTVEKPLKSDRKMEINTTDTSALKFLPGIGSKLAFRIVKYRDNLGGFYSTGQLKEIYGLSDSTLQKILPLLTVSGEVRKLKVNAIDFTKIYHPYFDKKQSSVIQNYIMHHKPVRTLEDFKKIEIFDQVFWDRLAPYLDFSLE